MTYIQTNNPINRKNSPLRVDPFSKKKDKSTVISPGVISIKDPASESISVHGGENPYKLTPGVDGIDQDYPFEEMADMEGSGTPQPNYEDENRKPGDNTLKGRF